MLIKSYGLFWRAEEIDWHPGKGKKGAFRLLGRQGRYLPGLRLVDVRWMQGIYVLYGEYGPHYVGLTRRLGLGRRLGHHLHDEHEGMWDRFSWFGFQKVLGRPDHDGLQELASVAQIRTGTTDAMIGDIEALLIKAMGLRNKADMNFADESEWEQVRRHEVEHFLEKVEP
jgi:hypothetical protein